MGSKQPVRRGCPSGGGPHGSPRCPPSRPPSSLTITPRSRTMATSRRSSRPTTPAQASMFSLGEPPARALALPVFVVDYPTLAETSRWPSSYWLAFFAPDGSSGKTSPVSCRSTEGGPLVPSSGGWQTSGMGGPTESWTLNTSDWPSDASVCSLSQVLVTGDVPRKYFLSPKACAGILRRAAKRGRELPEALRLALEAVARTTTPGRRATSYLRGSGTWRRTSVTGQTSVLSVRSARGPVR